MYIYIYTRSNLTIISNIFLFPCGLSFAHVAFPHQLAAPGEDRPQDLPGGFRLRGAGLRNSDGRRNLWLHGTGVLRQQLHTQVRPAPWMISWQSVAYGILWHLVSEHDGFSESTNCCVFDRISVDPNSWILDSWICLSSSRSSRNSLVIIPTSNYSWTMLNMEMNYMNMNFNDEPEQVAGPKAMPRPSKFPSKLHPIL